MRKFSLVVVGCVLATASSLAENRLGVTAGLNLSYSHNNRYDADWSHSHVAGATTSVYSYPGVNVGISFERFFAGSAKGCPFWGLSFLYSNENLKYYTSWMGKNETYGDGAVLRLSDGSKTEIERYHFVKLPVALGYNFKVSDALALSPKGGVVFAQSVGNDFPYFSFGAELGLNVNVGRHYQVAVAHEWGIANRFSGGHEASVARNFSVNLTYFPFNF